MHCTQASQIYSNCTLATRGNGRAQIKTRCISTTREPSLSQCRTSKQTVLQTRSDVDAHCIRLPVSMRLDVALMDSCSRRLRRASRSDMSRVQSVQGTHVVLRYDPSRRTCYAAHAAPVVMVTRTRRARADSTPVHAVPRCDCLSLVCVRVPLRRISRFASTCPQ
jgi:hypothetical protein